MICMFLQLKSKKEYFAFILTCYLYVSLHELRILRYSSRFFTSIDDMNNSVVSTAQI